jgi:gamma-glutamyltranspeptidase / glutathione hydrolase
MLLVTSGSGDVAAWRSRALTASLVSLVAVVAALPTPAAAQDGVGKQPTAVGRGGAAASVDLKATNAAIRTLRRGGNAVDATVAAAGVLGVTKPYSAGIGGGGFMVVRTPAGEVRTIDGRETAPRAIRPRSFFENGVPLDFNSARYSGLSAGVPGTVAQWDRALDRFGTFGLAQALEPGINVARNGFRIDQTFFDQTLPNVDYFDDVPSTEEIYLDPDGTPRDVGSRLRNPDMARAYSRIGRLGPAGFYRGRIAAAMIEAAQDPPISNDANHIWRPGLITRADVDRYQALNRPPTRVGYRGLDVWGMRPPSSGGSTVGETLNILEGYTPLGSNRAEALHRFLEASRYSFADRGAYLADPAYFDVPLSGLLSGTFAAERRALITDQAADSGAVAPGQPRDNGGDPGRASADTEGRSTTHLTVADRNGMVASYTFTIEATGGNGIVVPGWGFLLNNELTDFDYADPEHPNRPQGGKRPRSSMAPTIVTRDGRPRVALGSPGGSTIITTVVQLLIERFDFDKTLPQAIAAPRASQRNSPTTNAEQRFISSKAGQRLQSEHGHTFVHPTPTPPGELGAATGIELLRGKRFRAAAEPERRGGGAAAVVSSR